MTFNYEEYRKKQERRAKQFLSPLKDVLAAGNLEYVTIKYDGGGDCGQFDFDTFKLAKKGSRARKGKEAEKALTQKVKSLGFTQTFNPEKTEWDEIVAENEVPMWEWFVDAAHFAVSIWHAGWENNEGGFGTVRFSAEGIKVDHSENVMTTEDFHYSLSAEELTDVG